MDWYETLNEVLPGRVEFAFPCKDALIAELKDKAPVADDRRFDVSVLDAMLECLAERQPGA